MSEILNLEQRLNVALSRISISAEALTKAAKIGDASSSLDPPRAAIQSSDAVALAQVRSSLTAATSKITEQDKKIIELVQALEVTRENQLSLMPADDTQSNLVVDAVSALEVELSQLTQSNTQLRQANQGLRDANSKELGDVGLINLGLQSELDSLHAERTADKAQLHVLLTALSEAGSIDVMERKKNA